MRRTRALARCMTLGLFAAACRTEVDEDPGASPRASASERPVRARVRRTLVVDAGRTTCRVGVVSDGRLEAVTEVVATATFADPTGPGVIPGMLADAAAELGSAREGCNHLVGGFAGIWQTGRDLEPLAAAIGAAVGVAEVALTNDVVTAYAGALGPVPGVVVIAGSGAVALGVGPDGEVERVDGWGWTFGDAGSGHWIGRLALEQVLRSLDGRGRATRLVDHARERFGAPEHLHGTIAAMASPARTVASFAPEVLAAAEDGDAVALDVVDAAAGELATTVQAAAARTHRAGGAVPVSLVGGLGAAPLLVARLERRLAEVLPSASWQAPLGDALRGAGRLAAEAGPLAGLVTRWRAPPSA